MGATVDMHQIYDAHIHQKDGAPVEFIPFALKIAPDPNRPLLGDLQEQRDRRRAPGVRWNGGEEQCGRLRGCPHTGNASSRRRGEGRRGLPLGVAAARGVEMAVQCRECAAGHEGAGGAGVVCPG